MITFRFKSQPNMINVDGGYTGEMESQETKKGNRTGGGQGLPNEQRKHEDLQIFLSLDAQNFILGFGLPRSSQGYLTNRNSEERCWEHRGLDWALEWAKFKPIHWVGPKFLLGRILSPFKKCDSSKMIKNYTFKIFIYTNID